MRRSAGLILESGACRLVIDETGRRSPQIQVHLRDVWQTAAELARPVIERPGGQVEAGWSAIRTLEVGFELAAYLEDAHGRWEIIDQIRPITTGFEIRRTWRHLGGMDPQVALLFETAYPGLQVDFWMIPGLMVQGNPIAGKVIARQPGDFGLSLFGAQPEQMNSRDWAYGYVALGKGAARVLIAWNQVLNLATLERVRRQFPRAAAWMEQPGD